LSGLFAAIKRELSTEREKGILDPLHDEKVVDILQTPASVRQPSQETLGLFGRFAKRLPRQEIAKFHRAMRDDKVQRLVDRSQPVT